MHQRDLLRHHSLPGMAISPELDVLSSSACMQKDMPAACSDPALLQSGVCTTFVLRIQQGRVLRAKCLADISIKC